MSMAPADAVKDLAPAGSSARRHQLRERRARAARPERAGARGVSGDLARELAKRLGVPVHFVSFEGAGGVFDAA